MPRRDAAKERYWRGLLRQWQRSGLTGREFCFEHRLSEPSFYAWRREIGERDREKAAARARRTVAASPLRQACAAAASAGRRSRSRAGGAFVKVAFAASAAPAPAIEVVVGDGRVLRVRAGFDAELLRQLVRLLEEPTC